MDTSERLQARLKLEIVRLRKALDEIRRESMPMGTDWGNSKVDALAQAALSVPIPGLNTKCSLHNNEHPDYLCPRFQKADF